ncbi:MAG: hypothetical protein IPP83_03170 [Flavobacteriales bacterium]|nr:hypothetical protein [Flavobacteriales bacterium]
MLIGRPLIELVPADSGTDTPLNLLFSGSARHRVPTADPRVLANINTPEEHSRHYTTGPDHAY